MSTLSGGLRPLLASVRGDQAGAARAGGRTASTNRHYPPAVTRLVLIEPDPLMRRRLRSRAARLGRDAEILDATAGQLPFPDASFDTAVVTFTLCSVPDEQAALNEITRVLAPGGRLLCFEHVRSADPRLAAHRGIGPLRRAAEGARDRKADDHRQGTPAESRPHGGACVRSSRRLRVHSSASVSRLR
jgi:SAM-dependent methyltransferase